MYVEINGFIAKGSGQILVKKLAKNKSVISCGYANGRAKDLFEFQAFGDASESEFFTAIVIEKDSDRIFNDLFRTLKLDNKNQGIIFQNTPIMKSSF